MYLFFFFFDWHNFVNNDFFFSYLGSTFYNDPYTSLKCYENILINKIPWFSLYCIKYLKMWLKVRLRRNGLHRNKYFSRFFSFSLWIIINFITCFPHSSLSTAQNYSQSGYFIIDFSSEIVDNGNYQSLIF